VVGCSKSVGDYYVGCKWDIQFSRCGGMREEGSSEIMRGRCLSGVDEMIRLGINTDALPGFLSMGQKRVKYDSRRVQNRWISYILPVPPLSSCRALGHRFILHDIVYKFSCKLKSSLSSPPRSSSYHVTWSVQIPVLLNRQTRLSPFFWIILL
jgi:hypothetical protein